MLRISNDAIDAIRNFFIGYYWEIEFCKVVVVETLASANAYWVGFGCSRVAVRRAASSCYLARRRVAHRATTTGYVLTARGRRVLEDVRAKERRLNPARAQRRNFGKLNGGCRCADQWRMSDVIVIPRCDHRHRAGVLGAICIFVHALVQRRRSTQRKRAEKCRGNECRDKGASVII